ncbi:MAG: 4Fe-4S binding protein [Candidatus Bathyarchaeota archaeon]|nr:4Fe-4S binding protein [Candidatus Bathyarchaeota archaeon]
MSRLAVFDVERCVGCQLCMFACNRRFGNGGLAKSAIWVRSAGGFERGFVVIVCRACPDPPCMKVCPTDALRPRKGGGVILDVSKCIGCKLCVDTCPVKAVFWDDESNKPNICTHCGYCIDYCPYDILRMSEVKVK